MARIIKNIIFKGSSGKIGEFIVLKQYKGKTIICKYPDRSRVRLSKQQKKNNQKFKRAVKYAQGIMEDEKLFEQYKAKAKKGQRVFHCAVSDYMRREQGRS